CVVDDASPQAVPHVRRDGVDLTFGAVECQRERLLLGHPEGKVERRFQPRRSTAPLLGINSVPVPLGEERSGLKRRIYVALYLTQCNRRVGQMPIGTIDAVEKFFPA